MVDDAPSGAAATAAEAKVAGEQPVPPLMNKPLYGLVTAFAVRGGGGFVPRQHAGHRATSSTVAVPPPSEQLTVLGVGVGLQGVGTAETAYLTFLKLTSSAPALCTAQGSCEAVLSSQWSQVCAGQRHEGSYYPPFTFLILYYPPFTLTLPWVCDTKTQRRPSGGYHALSSRGGATGRATPHQLFGAQAYLSVPIPFADCGCAAAGAGVSHVRRHAGAVHQRGHR